MKTHYPTYPSFAVLCLQHRLNLQRRLADGWRLCEREYGHVAGLPNSWGVRVATNGVMCLIDVGNPQGLLEYHHEWFESEPLSDEDREALGIGLPKANKPKSEKQAAKEAELARLLEAYA